MITYVLGGAYTDAFNYANAVTSVGKGYSSSCLCKIVRRFEGQI